MDLSFITKIDYKIIIISVLLLINIIQVLILYFKNERANKKKTYALILSKDKKTIAQIEVDSSKETFEFIDKDNNPHTHNLTEPYIKFNNFKFLLYELGQSDPIDVLDKQNSRMKSDVYKSILDNKALKDMNKYSADWLSGLGKYAFVGVVIIIFIIILAQRSGIFS